MAKQTSSKASSCSYILAATVGAIAVIAAAVLGHERVIDILLQWLEGKTEDITIYADNDYSGASIYYSEDDMLTFTEANRIVGPGDTSGDQLSKAFLSFYLGEIPQNSKILEARMDIYCDLEGNPEPLGALTLKEFHYGEYEQADFYGAPKDTWRAIWRGPGFIEVCRQADSLLVSGRTFRHVIEQDLPNRWAEFILCFEEDLITPNQSTDAIILRGPPSLYIKYSYREPFF